MNIIKIFKGNLGILWRDIMTDPQKVPNFNFHLLSLSLTSHVIPLCSRSPWQQGPLSKFASQICLFEPSWPLGPPRPFELNTRSSRIYKSFESSNPLGPLDPLEKLHWVWWHLNHSFNLFFWWTENFFEEVISHTTYSFCIHSPWPPELINTRGLSCHILEN